MIEVILSSHGSDLSSDQSVLSIDGCVLNILRRGRTVVMEAPASDNTFISLAAHPSVNISLANEFIVAVCHLRGHTY